MVRDPLNSYGAWLQRRFGGKVGRVTIDVGADCPHRRRGLDNGVDRGGCTYCDPRTFMAGYMQGLPLERQLENGRTAVRYRYRSPRFIAYFNGYTPTRIGAEALERAMVQCAEFDGVVGIGLATRPDCLPDEVLELLARIRRRYGLMVSLELGAESSEDSILRRVNRGHDVACTREAVRRARAVELDLLGVQLIVGWPGEEARQTAGFVNGLEVDAVKLHHLEILAGTPLATTWREGRIEVLNWPRFRDMLIEIVANLDPRIVVLRLLAEHPPQRVLVPQWGIPKAAAIQQIREEMRRRNLRQGDWFGECGERKTLQRENSERRAT